VTEQFYFFLDLTFFRVLLFFAFAFAFLGLAFTVLHFFALGALRFVTGLRLTTDRFLDFAFAFILGFLLDILIFSNLGTVNAAVAPTIKLKGSIMFSRF
jgi:hypothetical protein